MNDSQINKKITHAHKQQQLYKNENTFPSKQLEGEAPKFGKI